VDYRSRYPVFLVYLSKFIDIFLVIAGITVLLLIFTNAVLRGAAGFDLAWSLEATAFLILWLTFMGCAAATARGAHMRVSEVAAHVIPKQFLPKLEMLINIVIAVLLGSLIYYGITISTHTWLQKTTVLYWPVGLLYASMPVGMSLALIFHLFNAKLDLRTGGALVASLQNTSENHHTEEFE